jgi:RNA polymerase sigma factor (sigma-70 family)
MRSSSELPDPAPGAPQAIVALRPALVKYFQRKTGSVVEAEDLAQDVLVQVLTQARHKSPADPKAYVFRTALNRWRDRLRRRQARGTPVPWDEEAAEAQSAERSPEHALLAEEQLAYVARALRRMPARTRSVLLLVRLEHLRIATVAQMLGISVSAVNKHLARALASLAESRMRQEGKP